MINIVVAYDDNDPELSEYFEKTYTNFIQIVAAANETVNSALRGLDCTELNVNNAVIPLNAGPFLFAGFSHGDSTGYFLLTGNDHYVSANNSVNFSNCLFYSTGCHIGLNLAPDLINRGCRAFIGYADSSYAPQNETYDELFIECELFALNQFLATTRPLNELFNDMLNHTQIQIDWLSQNNEILEAMDLQSNKDCMILLGNGALTKSDFIL